MKKKLLLLGIGNVLMADEGIGVHLARCYPPQPGLDILDGGTGGFHLLEYFQQYEEVILVDATLDGQEPGTIRQLQPMFAADFPRAMSTHDIGLKDLVGALQLLGHMPRIHLFVVSISSIQQQGIELTPSIRAILPDLQNRIGNLVSSRLSPVYT